MTNTPRPSFNASSALLLAVAALVALFSATWFFGTKTGKTYAAGAGVAATIVYTGLTFMFITEGRRAEARRRGDDEASRRQRLADAEDARVEQLVTILWSVKRELVDNIMSVGNPVFATLQASPDASWRYLDEAIPSSRQLLSKA